MSLPNELVYLGKTCDFQDICLLYPPTIGDIVKIGYDKFRLLYKTLTNTSDDIHDLYVALKVDGEVPTPFEHLLLMSQIPDLADSVNEAFKFFTHEKVLVLFERSEIVIGDIKEKHIINEDNFFDFQNAIRQLVGDKEEEPLDPDMDPRLLRMRAKQRERDKVKAKQAEKENGASFGTLMLATCCLGVGVTVFNIEDLSYAAMMKFQTLMAHKDKYETDIASMIAGADGKKLNLEYWVKD